VALGHQAISLPGLGVGARGSGATAPVGVLSAVSDLLTSNTPLDRMRPRTVRSNMLQYMRFLPLLNVNGADADSPWPAEDPYERFGADKFPADGPIIWFEPLPPMMADLEKVPKLPLMTNPDQFTLVLDLDETLVHYFELNGVGNYGIRPGMFDFLQKMNSLGYELVIFTAATQDYADWVIDQIDPEHFIHHRLYRQHALPWGPLFAKDLSRLGRDLDKTLIIDNVQENFMMQPNNGIFIATWYDDVQDTALFDLAPLLEELVMTRVRVPDILSKYREQIPIWAGFGRWDLTDTGFDQPLDTPPPQMQQELPPQQAARQPMVYQGQAVAEPARVSAAGPSPPPYSSPYQQSPATGPGGMPNNSNAGYPDQQQPWPQQQVPQQQQQQQQQMQPRPMAAHQGISGPYQHAPHQQQQQQPQQGIARPAFGGIAGPYQAPLSRPVGR